ncbi:MAG: META domain-containing protein [Anaerolineae bacterium]
MFKPYHPAPLTILMAVLLALAACRPTAPWAPQLTSTPQATAPSPPAPSLAGSEWALISLRGQPLLTDTHISLVFEADQAGGFSGCNRYGGPYTVTGAGKLTFPGMSVTLMACLSPEGVMDQEERYLKTLGEAAAYRLTDDRLEVQDAAGETILTFVRRPVVEGDPAKLVGTVWRLTALDGQAPLASSTLTLAFHSTPWVSGHAGCRDYLATYQAEGAELTFPFLAMLGPVCADENRLEQEGTYTTLLGWVNHYRLAGDQLELSTLRGETLTFDPWPQDDWLPLEGPTWSLIAFIEPNPQAEPPDSIPLPADLLVGTEITATFAGGAVRGSTGCNHYSAAYQPQGDSLIVGSIAVTEMACLDPEGIMDQEGRFLDLLARVTGYHIYGNRLWLRTGDGHVVVFRAPDG